MVLDGYVRVSRVAGREGESFISPTVQRQRCEAMAQAKGFEIADWHEDLDRTGANSDRPGLQLALERVEQGKSSGIVVWKLSRFGRNAADILENLKRLRAAGGDLFTVEEGIDTSGMFGRFVMTIMAAIAELEWEQRREGWETAREEAVGRGVHVSSRTPTGYVKGDGGRLVPEPVAAAAIGRVFEARGRGASWRDCAAILEAAGVRTSYGGVNWTPQVLRNLIRNRVYLGEARSGEFIRPDSHPAIVDAETWSRAQVDVDRPGQRVGSGGELSGLLRCAGCSFSMKPDSMRKRDGAKQGIYRCRGKFSFGTCTSRASVTSRIVEEWVEEHFFGRIPALQIEAIDANEELAAAENELARGERELIAYRDAENVLGEYFLDGLTERKAAVDRAQSRVDELRRGAQVVELPAVSELRALWVDLSIDERRELLRREIDAVFLRSVARRNAPIGERAIILWRGEGPDGLPSLRTRGVVPRPFVWGDDEAGPGVAAFEDQP